MQTMLPDESRPVAALRHGKWQTPTLNKVPVLRRLRFTDSRMARDYKNRAEPSSLQFSPKEHVADRRRSSHWTEKTPSRFFDTRTTKAPILV
jgi:hypothetical protein